ncbi:MAG: hypothetical protein E6G06_05635 [Actinobacteria bacterium]|nr:MAG: hypothetical protein E6G06_05635 [Actinomycetota bacterium]
MPSTGRASRAVAASKPVAAGRARPARAAARSTPAKTTKAVKAAAPAKPAKATGRAVKPPAPTATKRPPTKATTTKAAATRTATKAGPTRAVPTKAVPAKGKASPPAKVKPASAKPLPAKAAPTKTAPTKAAAPKAAVAKPVPDKAVAAKATPVKTVPAKAAKEAPAPKPVKTPAPRKPSAATLRFFEKQREKLLEERATYTHQAETLRLEAEQLAEEMEPGDIQFDEESGEGATMNVERERDLTLSAQASAAVDEIDRALAKIDAGTYGLCEQCGQPIVRARLEALPYASLCVACKSGGLSRR